MAGTGAAGFSGDGGPAAQAALNQPKALAVLPDLSGFLVGDSANNRVRLVRMDLRPPLVLRILTKPCGRRQVAPQAFATRSPRLLRYVWRSCGEERSSCVSARPKAGSEPAELRAHPEARRVRLRLRATASGGRSDTATTSLAVRKRR